MRRRVSRDRDGALADTAGSTRSRARPRSLSVPRCRPIEPVMPVGSPGHRRRWHRLANAASGDARTGLLADLLGGQEDPFDPGGIDLPGDEIRVAEDSSVQAGWSSERPRSPARRGRAAWWRGPRAASARGRSACPAGSRNRAEPCSRPGCANPSERRDRRGFASR